MNKYRFKIMTWSKKDILELRIGRIELKPHRDYLFHVSEFIRKQNIKRGTRWRYRNRQIARKMRFGDKNWQFNVRRKLTHPKRNR